MIVEERQRDIGQFLVGRLLPFRKKRLVGPFCFIDHMGPTTLGNGKSMDVDQHPHIGLSTLTYLLAGEIEHRDSLGTVKIIRPGSVNFMTAGSGVTHTERTPANLRKGPEFLMHGYQIWVAMPKDKEEMEPSFQHIPANHIPGWQEGGLYFKLVAGEGYGKKSPLEVYSPLFMLDVSSEDEADTLEINGQLEGEIAIVVVEGAVTCSETIGEGQMLISKTNDACTLRLEPNSRVLLFGGHPFPEERFMYWNFVSHSKERLQQAKADWQMKAFPQVPGDRTYIPLPGKR